MTTRRTIDPMTPVLVGVGQASERREDDDYQRRSAVQLAAAAALEAILDTHCGHGTVAGTIDTIAGVRQFENSAPRAHAPLGRSNNFPRSVAMRIGADPRRAILEVGGGQSPQHLVTELAAEIARGNAETALIVGAEAISTTRHLANEEDRPSFEEKVGGDLEDRGFGLDGLVLEELSRHRVSGAPPQYALLENARRAKLRMTRDEYAASMGMLFAPFSEVAARNPHAATRTVRGAAELVTPTPRNRVIADPYTRFVVARDQVNQGAALLLMSVGAASRMRVPEERWVYLHGHCDLREQVLLDRSDLSRSPSSVLAIEHALELAGCTVDELATIDLYSCFPIAVFNVCDALGLRYDDPRRLTVTGGLPFFGGPGNNYSTHAICETVQLLRRSPGKFGLVGANGGTMSKYSAAVYGTAPATWRDSLSSELQEGLDRRIPVDTVVDPRGSGVIEACTVRHVREEQVGIVIGRQRDGRRFVAMSQVERDVDLLREEEPVGIEISVRSQNDGNHFARIS